MAQLLCYQDGSKSKKGVSLGKFRLVYGMSRVLGPLIGGSIYESYGGTIVWYLCGGIGFIYIFSISLYVFILQSTIKPKINF